MLPRTCDSGSTAAGLPFCDHAEPVAARITDLLSRLTREEKINLVTQADTGFLPRLNLKEFHFFNTCVHGWWTSNVQGLRRHFRQHLTYSAALHHPFRGVRHALLGRHAEERLIGACDPML